MMTSERSISVSIFLGFDYSLEDLLGMETKGCEILEDFGGEELER